MMIEVGDVISDCPSCKAIKAVVYKGENTAGEREAVCGSCNEVFELEDDEKEKQPPPSQPEPTPPPQPVQETPEVAPPPPSAPPPPKEVPDRGVGKLKPVTPVDIETKKAALKLDPDNVKDFGGDVDETGVPSHIRNGRAWRWAHKLGNTGNPYREDTKNHKIFQIYSDNHCTVEECVLKCVELGYDQKLSYLLTVYEVTSHCLASGLLVYNGRNVQPCQGKPIPVKLT